MRLPNLPLLYIGSVIDTLTRVSFFPFLPPSSSSSPMPQSDSERSDASDEQRNSVLRPPLTSEEIETVKVLRSAFKQTDAPVCCFGHVPFEVRDPKIFYSTVPALATEGSLSPKPQTKGYVHDFLPRIPSTHSSAKFAVPWPLPMSTPQSSRPSTRPASQLTSATAPNVSTMRAIASHARYSLNSSNSTLTQSMSPTRFCQTSPPYAECMYGAWCTR